MVGGRTATWQHWSAIAIVVLHVVLLCCGAWIHSPTYDELPHLVAGLSHWRLGRFDLYRVNPPLTRLVAALPVLMVGACTPWTRFDDKPGARGEVQVSADFVRANGRRIFQLVTYARWACIAFSIVGAWTCYRLASEVYGSTSGVAALALWCFCPNILAHAQLITPDAGAAAMGVLAAYAFWRWLRSPGWTRCCMAGLALGLAELSKSTWMILYGCWPSIWLLWRFRGADDVSRRPPVSQLAVVLAAGCIVLNMGYGWEGTGTRLGDYQFASRWFSGNQVELGTSRLELGNRWRGSWAGSIPIPLPRNYVMGIDLQKWEFDRGKRSYLLGEFRLGGWWYYYLACLAVKVPLGSILLASMALGLTFSRRFCRDWRRELFLLLPAVVLFAFVSAHTGFSHHFRYVLPAFPLIMIWASKVFAVQVQEDRLITALGGLAVAGSIISSLCVYPHSLSYFNLIAGGPSGGHRYVGAIDVDSGLDWGQDLLLLKRWLDSHGGLKLDGVAYNGPISASVAGINAKPPSQGAPSPGWYAVSGCHMWTPGPYSYFRDIKPTARIGYTIFVFHVESRDLHAETGR